MIVQGHVREVSIFYFARSQLILFKFLMIVQVPREQASNERGTATSEQLRQLDLEYQDWARLPGRGPHTAGGHGRNRHVGWQEQ
jgi:hypothetical protein